MKKIFYLSLSLCSFLVLFSCSKKQNNYQVIETVSQPNDSMMIVSGVIAEQTGPNTLSIISMEGDTIWFTHDAAIVEGSGIYIGDSAIVYYTVSDILPNTSPLQAKKIVTKKAIQHTSDMHKSQQK
ncbi:MAG: hypothetical protein IKU59_04315 [Bacteroidales bacterium]|nr:hypothetical protein [Bacteroidales bacterium]